MPARKRTSPEDIRARIEEIRRALPDNETAHILEDELYQDVLRQIWRGGHSRTVMQRLAEAALEAMDVEYDRWMA